MTKLETEYKDPVSLLPNPWNPNVVDPINQDKIENSLKEDGFFKPIIVRQRKEGLEIIAGQHRVQAAIALGINQVPVNNLGRMTDGRAKRLGQIDNARYGEDDPDKLSELYTSGDMGSVEEILSVLPITEEELAGCMSHLTMDEELEELEDTLSTDVEIDLEIGKSARTHRILRFKMTISDAEAVMDRIAEVKHKEGFTESDDLTNAADALLHMLAQEVEL